MKRWISCTWLLLAACDGSQRPPLPLPAPGIGWAELMAEDWALPPGTERFPCYRQTVTEDVYVAGLRPISPTGTHHAAAVLDADPGPDGPFDCGMGNVNTNGKLLFAAGIGTGDFVLPAGTALRIPAGTQITMSLHLFNTGTAPLSGRSGIAIERVSGADTLAVMSIAGVSGLQPMPPSNIPTTATGGCRFAADATILELVPHMHRIGRHMTITLDQSVVLDKDFNFLEQRNYPMALSVHAGDELMFTCTWLNDTDATVYAGQSSLSEMCAMGMFVSPASAAPECTHM
jgi:hypothetical protein